MLSRFNAIAASGIIALSGCATTAQPKIAKEPATNSSEPYPNESVDHYMVRLGIHDPASRRAEEEARRVSEVLNRQIAVMVAEVLYVQSADYVKNCMYVQQYDRASREIKIGKCVNEVLDVIDQNPRFQEIDPSIQEKIKEELRKRIMETM